MKEVKQYPLPQHIAIIMDGNRRFAKELGLDPAEGHRMGRDKLEEVLGWCLDIGIRVLTVYAFSTENFMRSTAEVQLLIKLFEENFRKLGDDERVHKHGIKVRVLGRRNLLPDSLISAIEYAENRTKDYNNYFFNLAVAYGGRQEIIDAIREIARDVKEGKISVNDISEELVSSKLYTKDLPDPDLILRTSGEERISNFLLWQMAYSELYFVDVYWPGFRKIDLLRAIRAYQLRQRRFGK
ncbi:MAG: polyprenyl diphosphate synthase [Thermoplasmata archaeon]|nr:polyprenyl diphosphate synthase [Thermoplasmata archaeon]